jgi:hypothetical protein
MKRHGIILALINIKGTRLRHWNQEVKTAKLGQLPLTHIYFYMLSYKNRET